MCGECDEAWRSGGSDTPCEASSGGEDAPPGAPLDLEGIILAVVVGLPTGSPDINQGETAGAEWFCCWARGREGCRSGGGSQPASQQASKQHRANTDWQWSARQVAGTNQNKRPKGKRGPETAIDGSDTVKRATGCREMAMRWAVGMGWDGMDGWESRETGQVATALLELAAECGGRAGTGALRYQMDAILADGGRRMGR